MKNRTATNPRKQVNKSLLILTLVLVTIGIVAVADASAPTALSNFSDKFYFAKQQLMWGAVGIVAMLVVSKLNYKIWSTLAVPMMIVNIFFLIIVLIPAFAPSLLGARRWLFLGPFSFQPSELMKLTIAVYLAKVTQSSKGLMAFLAPIGLTVLLIMMEPDLGTTVVISLIAFAQMFMANIPLLHFAGISLAGISVSFLLILSSPYRKDRLLTFLQETSDPLGKGYHIRQILFALGSGGLFGVGLGQSRQKYLFLPEAATDSIFAIIAEEIGFVGGVALITLFGAFVYIGMRVVKNAPDTFSRSLGIGIVTWIGGQSFVNIAAMIALVPLTGIPFPFISYGGSSLIMLLVATGILLNISTFTSNETKIKRLR